MDFIFFPLIFINNFDEEVPYFQVYQYNASSDSTLCLNLTVNVKMSEPQYAELNTLQNYNCFITSIPKRHFFSKTYKLEGDPLLNSRLTIQKGKFSHINQQQYSNGIEELKPMFIDKDGKDVSDIYSESHSSDSLIYQKDYIAFPDPEKITLDKLKKYLSKKKNRIIQFG